MSEAESSNGWHLKREIQIGHIVATLTVAAGAVAYMGKIEQRLQRLEDAAPQQRERDERQDKAAAESVALLRQQLQRMDDKLDRILEIKRGK